MIVNTSEEVQNPKMKESGDGKEGGEMVPGYPKREGRWSGVFQEGGGMVLGYPMTLCALCR